MTTGTVRWWNDAKGFGYIMPDDGSADLFVHFSGINMRGFQTLREGQKVSYELVKGPRGGQASNVMPAVTADPARDESVELIDTSLNADANYRAGYRDGYRDAKGKG